jgi:hypothetical protein
LGFPTGCLTSTIKQFFWCHCQGLKKKKLPHQLHATTSTTRQQEAKKSLNENAIKSEDVKNLPPIEELCKPIPRSSTIELHSLQRFNNRDIPYSKPPDQCLDELDNFIVKQDNFNKKVQNHLLENSRAINKLHDIVERTSNDVKMLVKHFQMVQTQIDQLTKVQKDLLVNASREKHACEISTISGAST